MATVRARLETKKLYIDFRYLGMRCREQSHLTKNAKNIRKLKKLAKTIDAEVTLGTFDYSKTFPHSKSLDKVIQRISEQNNHIPIFEVYVKQWLRNKRPEWKQSYYKSVKSIIESYLLEEFGDKYLDKIFKTDLLEFRTYLSKLSGKNDADKISASRINHIMSPLIMILDDASVQYSFPFPAHGIKSLRIPRTQAQPFTLEEVKLIIDSVREDFKYYYTVRFFTGMRTGEIDGLKWQHVDLDKRQILICEALVSGQTVSPKNDSSYRAIDMTQTVYNAMISQYKLTGDGDYVFCTKNETPLNHNNVTNRVWHPLLKKLGLTARRPYVTRHTATTLWLACGESVEWIAKQLGHSSTELIHKTYSRFIPNLTRQDGSAFEKLLQHKYHI